MSNNNSSFFSLLPMLLLIAFLGLLTKECHGGSFSSESGGDINISLPQFEASTLNPPGGRFNADNLTGHAGLIVFWASWCPYCRAEFPMLMKIQQNYSLPIYGFAVGDNPTNALGWLEHAGNPFTLSGIDMNHEMEQTLGVSSIPAVFLLDKHGTIRYRFMGNLSENAWNTELLPLINKYNAEP